MARPIRITPLRVTAVALSALVVALAAGKVMGDQTLVRLTPEQSRAMSLKTTVAVAATDTPLASLPATVTPALNGRVVAAVPFAAVVVRVDVLEGQAVGAGQPLAVLFSQDALKVSAELAQANAEVRMTEAAARRTRTLASEGIIAEARSEEASTRAEQARIMANERGRLLASAGGAGRRAGEYVLKAPIAGRVSQLNLQPGSGVEAMAPGAVIDRDDRLWVEARLPADIAGQVEIGSIVEVAGARGRVVAVGSAIDPRTRSVVMRAELASGADVVPGEATMITVTRRSSPDAVAVPRVSLIQINGRDTVFVRRANGYLPMAVTVEGRSDAQAVVTGLNPGDEVVTSGVSQLKTASEG